MSYHFTHPNHPLYEIFVEREYLCDGCNTLGRGKAYFCTICNFALHEVCAKCPSTFTSNLHPSHPLVLTRHAFGRFCDLCCEEARGLHYACELCRFVLHPLCTQLPKSVPHQVHPQHVLTLCRGNNLYSRCAVCQSESDIWSYRCEPCGVAVHLECASEQGSPPNRVDQPAPEQTRGLHHTHPHHGPGHAYSNNNMGYHYHPYNYNPHNNNMGYHYYPYNYNPYNNNMYSPLPQPPPPHPPPGSSGNGRKRKRMYQIVGAVAANITASVIGGFLFPF